MPDQTALRLIAVDLDGTLLDEQGRVPDELWPLLDVLHERGIVFVPASGRQYATLHAMFERAADGMVFVAENGTYVVRDGIEVSSSVMDQSTVGSVVEGVRRRASQGADVGVVVCGKSSAYVERTDRTFLDEAEKYYARLTHLSDVLDADDEMVKVAVFDFDGAELAAKHLSDWEISHRVVISGSHTVDVMNQGVDKGTAVMQIQNELGISTHQTAAFGDYLNDIEMLKAAHHSYAMANAHPEVIATARKVAPSNAEAGVITTVYELLGMAPISDR